MRGMGEGVFESFWTEVQRIWGTLRQRHKCEGMVEGQVRNMSDEISIREVWRDKILRCGRDVGVEGDIYANGL